jgi:hypothetical protein
MVRRALCSFGVPLRPKAQEELSSVHQPVAVLLPERFRGGCAFGAGGDAPASPARVGAVVAAGAGGVNGGVGEGRVSAGGAMRSKSHRLAIRACSKQHQRRERHPGQQPESKDQSPCPRLAASPDEQHQRIQRHKRMRADHPPQWRTTRCRREHQQEHVRDHAGYQEQDDDRPPDESEPTLTSGCRAVLGHAPSPGGRKLRGYLASILQRCR